LVRRQNGRKSRAAQVVSVSPEVSNYVGRQLVATPPQHSAISPLYFQNPTLKIIKSAGAKEKELKADIASKEERYKLTAQYVESLTRFMPELINYLLSRRMTGTNDKISLNTAQHLIKNIY